MPSPLIGWTATRVLRRFHGSAWSKRYLGASTTSSSFDEITSCLRDEMRNEESLHKVILDSLKTALGKDKPVSLEHIRQFTSADLQSLASSCSKKRRKRSRRPVHFQHTTTESTLEWRLGESLLDVAKANEDMMSGETILEGTCGGQMGCCTCHVYLDHVLYEVLDPPSQDENDMLDLAFERKEGESRLGCQVKLSPMLLEKLKDVDRLTVTIPNGVNNVWEE